VLTQISGLVNCLYQWQGLVAGILGFAAAILAVFMTLRSESRRNKRETLALKRALLSEMWGFAGQALRAHQILSEQLYRGSQIRVHDLEDAAHFPAPVIYPNIADKLGLLGEDAHHIVHFYQQLQTLKDTVGRIRRDFDRQRIEVENPEDAVEAFLSLAETAAPLLPRLRVSRADQAADPNFAVAVGQSRSQWARFRADRQNPAGG
jgi:hypothetical protein